MITFGRDYFDIFTIFTLAERNKEVNGIAPMVALGTESPVAPLPPIQIFQNVRECPAWIRASHTGAKNPTRVRGCLHFFRAIASACRYYPLVIFFHPLFQQP